MHLSYVYQELLCSGSSLLPNFYNSYYNLFAATFLLYLVVFLFKFNSTDVEMADGGTSQGVDSATLLKPVASIGKNKMKKQLRLKKMKKHGRGKIRKSHRI